MDVFKKVGIYARTDVDDYIGGDISNLAQFGSKGAHKCKCEFLLL